MKLKKCSMGVTLWAALAVCGCCGSNAVTNSTTEPAPASSPRQAATVQAATGDGSLTDSNLTYVGRWDKSDSTTYRSYWGGAYVSTKFTGTTVKVKLPAPVHFKYIIDGTLANYWAWGTDGTINLTPTPLANGTHKLKIIADINDGQVPFKGLVLDTGASTVAPDARPLVEFIGDSITAGHSTSEGPVTDYAWLTGEALGADHTQIAYSGITLADGHHYPDNHFPGMESVYFKLKAVNECPDVACTTNPAWNFSNYTAKVVVINLGTNDQNLGADSTGLADFQTRYTAFLQNIRAKYPNADIFAMQTLYGYYKTETQAAVNARLSAGDTKVHYINTDGWVIPSPSADFADYFHPSDAGHVKIMNRLAPILKPYLSGGGVNLLSNPGFENGLSGWGVWPAGPSYTEAWGANSGTSHVTHWGANPYYVTTYQGLTGLSNGLYTLRAWVKGYGGQRQMYVKNFGAAQMTADLPGSNAYTEVVIRNINVTNGTAEIGFFSNDPSGNNALLYVDDVTFYKQ